MLINLYIFEYFINSFILRFKIESIYYLFLVYIKFSESKRLSNRAKFQSTSQVPSN